MKKIIIKDMLIKVRKQSDNSEGWIKMTELVDTIVESILEEIEKENLTKHNSSSKKDCNLFSCTGNVDGKCNSEKACPTTKLK